MVFAVKSAGFLKQEYISGLFNDAQQSGIAAWIGADGAGLALGKRAAFLASPDFVTGAEDRAGQALSELGVGLDDMQSDAFGGSGANAWELGESSDKILQGFWEEVHAW
jgi:hypothetical protein